MKTKFITQAALIAAIYVVVTVVFAPFSFGEIQVRLSEALTILPVFTPAAIPGLFIGCAIGNILGGGAILDVVFGSIATLIGAVGTYLVWQRMKDSRYGLFAAALPPIVSNTLIVPWVLRYAYGLALPIPLMMLTVGIGEIVSCGILGIGLAKLIAPHKDRLFSSNQSAHS